MTDEYPPGYLDEQRRRVLWGRLGDAEELAAVVVLTSGQRCSSMKDVALGCHREALMRDYIPDRNDSGA